MIVQSVTIVAQQVLFRPLNVAPVSAMAVKVCSPTVRVAPSIVIIVPEAKDPDRCISSDPELRITPPLVVLRLRIEELDADGEFLKQRTLAPQAR